MLDLLTKREEIQRRATEELGRRFKGRITFWGEIDRQHLLVHGTRQDIEDAVRTVRGSLYADGGVIAQCEFGLEADPENMMAVFETWDRLDRPEADPAAAKFPS